MVRIKMKKSAIIIPVYYEKPTRLDRLALSTLSTNLEDFKEYDVFIVQPEGLGIARWKIDIDHDVITRAFSPDYFKSTLTYSSLLMSYDFWKEFEEYEYALLYQTDAYCVGGDLKHFIDLNVDYIGAPIIATDARWESVPAIGNGGVSLRKVATMIETTDPNGDFMKESGDMIKRLDEMNGNMYTTYEDLYFCQLVPKLWEFNLPTFNDAAHFSFDMNADVMYEMTNHELPLFVHALDKNIRFWQSHLPISPQISSDAMWKNKDGYLSQDVHYQDNLDYYNIQVGAIVCVKNENWRLDSFISKLEDYGFQKVIIVDNNDCSGELAKNGITSLHNIDIDYIEKFRGRKCRKDYDLISEMYKEAYLYHVDGLTHVMFLDADESIVFDRPVHIADVVYQMKNNEYQMMHVPVFRIRTDEQLSNWQDHKVKTIVETGHDLSQFYRETPVCNLDCCDNRIDVVPSDSRTLTYMGADLSSELIMVENWCVGDESEFMTYKNGRGWPDVEWTRGQRTCDIRYFNKVNEGTAIESSTLSIN